MRRRRLIGFTLMVLAVAAVVGYGAISVFAWTTLTDTAGSCAAYASTTPSDFTLAWTDASGTVRDAVPYRFAASDVTFPSRTSGLDIRAFWAAPPEGTAGRVVIVVHGTDSCRRDPANLLVAGMLAKHGYGVLAIDLRNFGESSRDNGHWAGGIDEWPDVLGAWDWVRAQGYAADRVGIFGESMGAAASAIAMAHEPGVAAAFLDSSFADIYTSTVYYAEMSGEPGWLVPGVLIVGQVLGGDNLLGPGPADLFQTSLAGRPIAIVHGAVDGTIDVEEASKLAAAAAVGGTKVTPWIVPASDHVTARFTQTAEFETRLRAFFDESLAP
ncbi:MAG: alpha/beta fold hydrolase [Chloroflexota bacterium]